MFVFIISYFHLHVRFEEQSRTLYMGNGKMIDLDRKGPSSQYPLSERPVKTIIDGNRLQGVYNCKYIFYLFKWM